MIYSRLGERADQVIQRLAEEYGPDCAVVSSDREVAGYARARGAFVISALEFESRLQPAGRSAVPDRRAEMGERDVDLPRRPGEKKGNPRKLPKDMRKRLRQLKSF